jgi:hypothetical protein
VTTLNSHISRTSHFQAMGPKSPSKSSRIDAIRFRRCLAQYDFSNVNPDDKIKPLRVKLGDGRPQPRSPLFPVSCHARRGREGPKGAVNGNEHSNFRLGGTSRQLLRFRPRTLNYLLGTEVGTCVRSNAWSFALPRTKRRYA